MTNLNIQTIDSSLVVDSRLVAAELGIEHRALKKTIQTYQSDFEEFGNLNTASVGVVGTSSYAEFYYLTEDQAYLSLTYSNNSQQVRQAKINLIKAFKQAREKAAQPQLPTDYLTALKALVTVEEEKQQLALEAAQLRPKAESWTRLCDTDGTMSIAAVAKNLAIPGMGPNNLFKFLRDKGFVFYDNQCCNIPKSTLVNDGYLRTVQKYDFKRNKNYSVCVCTFKGYSFIMKQLKKAGYTIPSDSPTTNEAALVA